ncbi:hypothetical protein QJS10_CPB18g00681 [Acorus calamus]|uniref:Uncharacterized protein n=1 Tax=Acorus calamus TaxID=4465 RepID=A0AAV9CLT3_ACOCL|nr:hypothetical protein QJS10_CPB18g00681 [Acorus calamus]
MELVDERQVQHYMVEFYKDLNKESFRPLPPINSYRKLSNAHRDALCLAVSEEEIYLNLKTMKGDGIPGSDGFNIGFFQRCWDVIKRDLIAVVQEFF